MNLIAAFFEFVTRIMDRLPSRRESILNQIQDTKDEIKNFQEKSSPWTIPDTVKYYAIVDKLSKLEKRRDNASR